MSYLQKVQWRREFPTKVTQWGQVQVQERILKPVLAAVREFRRRGSYGFQEVSAVKENTGAFDRNWSETGTRAHAGHESADFADKEIAYKVLPSTPLVLFDRISYL
jgi:hypothetical protein